MTQQPICRACERLSATPYATDGHTEAPCSCCGTPTTKCVPMGPLAPDPDVFHRAFAAYFGRLESAAMTALHGLAQMGKA